MRLGTSLWMWGLATLLAAASPLVGCDKKNKGASKPRPLVIDSIRVGFPWYVPPVLREDCKGTYLKYEFFVANARYTDDDGRLRDSVENRLSLIDEAGKVVWELKLSAPAMFRPVLKTSKLRLVGAACTDKKLASGRYTFRIHAYDREGGGKGTAEKRVTVDGAPRPRPARLAPLLAGYTRLPVTGRQMVLPKGARIKRGPLSSDEIVLKKHGAFVVRKAFLRNQTLAAVVAQLSKIKKLKIHRILLKKGSGTTFALIYQASWSFAPKKKRLQFQQVIRRDGVEFSCVATPRNKAAALAFHKLCSAIR